MSSSNHPLQAVRLVGQIIVAFPPDTTEELHDDVSKFLLFAQHVADVRYSPRNEFDDWIGTFVGALESFGSEIKRQSLPTRLKLESGTTYMGPGTVVREAKDLVDVDGAAVEEVLAIATSPANANVYPAFSERVNSGKVATFGVAFVTLNAVAVRIKIAVYRFKVPYKITDTLHSVLDTETTELNTASVEIEVSVKLFNEVREVVRDQTVYKAYLIHPLNV